MTKLIKAGTVTKILVKNTEKEKFDFEARCTDGQTHRFVCNRKVAEIKVNDIFTADGFFNGGWFIIQGIKKGVIYN